MENRIKKIIAAAVLIIAAAAAAVTAYAYLQREQDKQNKFTIGEDKVSITEEFSQPETVSMENNFTKKVQITNNGTSDQFVRVYMDFSDSAVRDKSTIVYTKNDTQQEKNWSKFLADLPDDWTFVSESATGDGAVLGGYFYYTKILAPEQSTPALIDAVKTDFREQGNTNDSNTDRITDFDIIVYTETVQTTEIDTNGTVYDDNGWQTAWKSFLGTT